MAKETPETKELPANLDFHFIKSNSFRVVHCDGVWGGTTPRGYITMSVYSERSPLPQKITHQVLDHGLLSPETSKEAKEGIIREVDVEVIMDLSMAQSLITWLQDHVKFLEKRPEAPQGGGK